VRVRPAPLRSIPRCAGHAGERGSYSVDEHLLSPQEVAARFGTSVEWASVPASKGLTGEQVGHRHAAQRRASEGAPPCSQKK
jgi:hypothetical protein